MWQSHLKHFSKWVPDAFKFSKPNKFISKLEANKQINYTITTHIRIECDKDQYLSFRNFHK